MSFGTALVAIVMIIAISVLMMQRAENRSDRIKKGDSGKERQLEQERDEARAELEDLRERVKVLERIATDPARRTAEEIDKLRDE
ncbi:hypothetical protein [Aurantiacibacter sp. MUD61]|uniref:hypothetical protein n=1 Tax=Aurantiacibacter sp. MUD61 TaxID=3009083 RepID=UPI0022F107BD|nr:hypothetical protein [Aurantiacibacter sp. MUD61]